MSALGLHPHRNLFTVAGGRTVRASSWDRSGRNRDWLRVDPGETVTVLEQAGAGCINHVYCAMMFPEIADYRDAIVRCYWDGETEPSVEVPLGDFFGLAHARVRELTSALVTVNPGWGSSHGLNAYFPMPFSHGAVVTLENRGDRTLGGLWEALWYHIDFELYDEPLPESVARFHAQWRQEHTQPVGDEPNVPAHEGVNLTGEHNYVAVEAAGTGQLVGLVLQIENLAGLWYGEGDDMVFVDGDGWPPSIHGTGTEEIFGGGACPNREYAGMYTGFHLVETFDFSGLIGMYRWFVTDPIRFTSSLRWTVEHGHANNFANRYASTAFWYQTGAHAPFPPLPSREEALPALGEEHDRARAALFGAITRERAAGRRLLRPSAVAASFYRGDWAATLQGLEAEGLV